MRKHVMLPKERLARGVTAFFALAAAAAIWAGSALAADLPRGRMSLDFPTATDNNNATYILDNSRATFAQNKDTADVAVITINLGSIVFTTPPLEDYTVDALRYLSRNNGDGNKISEYNIYYSSNSTNGTDGDWVEVVTNGNWMGQPNSDGEKKQVFDPPLKAKYLRLEATKSTASGNSAKNCMIGELVVEGTPPPAIVIPQKDVRISGNNNADSDHNAQKIIDGDRNTYWKSSTSAQSNIPSLLITLVGDAPVPVTAVRILPYFDTAANRINPAPGKPNIFYSSDSTNGDMDNGTWHMMGQHSTWYVWNTTANSYYISTDDDPYTNERIWTPSTGSPATAAPVMAKYIRVNYGGKNNAFAIAEINIETVAQQEPEEFSFDSVSYESSKVNGVDITAPEALEGNLIVAVYNDAAPFELRAVHLQSVSLNAGFSGSIPLENLSENWPALSDGDKVKLFIWDNISTIKPVVNKTGDFIK
ncbi:MAG: discoidin domain-containing protein [Firmicutes bacterium]|nr:discoidin domain-containing protein [Bacillota bacterium]